MNKILVLGRGYLGKEFERHGIETWGREKFDVDYKTKSLNGCTLADLTNFDVVVNCIGKSNTRWCEDPENFEESMYINGQLPKILSDYCNNNKIRFVQISTGCLYDNTNIGNTEESFISSHCNYVTTKWAGEFNCNRKTDLILRPRLYFSDINDRNNLLCKLPNFRTYTGDKLDSLTCTSTIVGATKHLLDSNQSGVFNVAQLGSATIARVAFWCGIEIKGINTAEDLRKQEGLYLVNNVMDITKLLKFYQPMNIEDTVKLSYAELKNK
jgi:dTDP-4-dehydrorhamnose reductase